MNANYTPLGGHIPEIVQALGFRTPNESHAALVLGNKDVRSLFTMEFWLMVKPEIAG